MLLLTLNCVCRLRWTSGNAQMLCYLRPFLDTRLSLIGRFAYTMANYGWVVGMLIWTLVSYVMIGWIVFQVTMLFNIHSVHAFEQFAVILHCQYVEMVLWTAFQAPDCPCM